jgi:hypothetical protein
MIDRSIQPAMEVGSYITYSISATRDVAVVTACKDAGCQAWAKGWETSVDEHTALGAQQAAYIRRKAGRTFTELHAGALTVFRFEPYQRCFAEHRTKPDVLLKRGGDFRQNLGTIRRFVNGGDWANDFAEHQDKINTQIERG